MAMRDGRPGAEEVRKRIQELRQEIIGRTLGSIPTTASGMTASERYADRSGESLVDLPGHG